MKTTMAQAWHTITETVTIASFTQGNRGIVRLVVEMLSDGRAEWTMQYGGHHQRSDISLTFDAAIAAAEAAARELDTARIVRKDLPP